MTDVDVSEKATEVMAASFTIANVYAVLRRKVGPEGDGPLLGAVDHCLIVTRTLERHLDHLRNDIVEGLEAGLSHYLVMEKEKNIGN